MDKDSFPFIKIQCWTDNAFYCLHIIRRTNTSNGLRLIHESSTHSFLITFLWQVFSVLSRNEWIFAVHEKLNLIYCLEFEFFIGFDRIHARGHYSIQTSKGILFARTHSKILSTNMKSMSQPRSFLIKFDYPFIYRCTNTLQTHTIPNALILIIS